MTKFTKIVAGLILIAAILGAAVTLERSGSGPVRSDQAAFFSPGGAVTGVSSLDDVDFARAVIPLEEDEHRCENLETRLADPTLSERHRDKLEAKAAETGCPGVSNGN